MVRLSIKTNSGWLIWSISARRTSRHHLPGDEYIYSNSNYTLMTLIVERVSGQSLAEFTCPLRTPTDTPQLLQRCHRRTLARTIGGRAPQGPHPSPSTSDHPPPHRTPSFPRKRHRRGHIQSGRKRGISASVSRHRSSSACNI